MTTSDVAAMFAAAARMYRAAPWKVLPPDVCIGVSCDVLGIVEGAMVVVGQMRESYGFSLFASMENAMAFYEAVEANERGEPLDVPGHIMFAYDSREELPGELVREIEHHHWAIADRDAYPSPTVIDDDRIGRGFTRVEMLGVSAIMTALSELVEHEPRLAEAWERKDAAITWNRKVETPLGSVTVELRAPVLLPLESSIAVTYELVDEDGELDEEELDEYAETLLDELEGVPGIHDMHLQCAEKLGMETAKECLASLAAPDLATRLERALADETRYSPAKAMIMQGIREGYDLTSERGVAAWVKELSRRAHPRRGTARVKRKASAHSKTNTSISRKPAASAKTTAGAKPNAKKGTKKTSLAKKPRSK